MKIIYQDWQIRGRPEPLNPHQYDNKSQRIQVVGELPEGYLWDLAVAVGEFEDIIPLHTAEGGAESDPLTADQLSIEGTYRVQLRGRLQADVSVLKHTNIAHVFVADSISGEGSWPELPTEFAQIEEKLAELRAGAEAAAKDAQGSADRAETAAGTAVAAGEAASNAAGNAGEAAKAARDSARASQEAADRAEAAGGGYEIGSGLKLDGKVLSVDTAEAVEQDNTKPVTSAAVFMQIGNIEALLAAL